MKKKVLVVENDQAIIEIVSLILEDEGYEVKALDTHSQILETIINYKPDVIILDIIRPSEEGTLLCLTLKKNAKTKHIPVIAFSTHPKVLTAIKEICADDVVPKPFDVAELINAVEMQLQ
jgi:two-component system phosphate regulon response regulator PhoB/two-component system alkaline phosphatase synthesis response regulator PhoP